MGQIARIDIRSEILIEVASMAVLHCRQEIHKLDYDAASVLDDVDEYRRLIRVMDIALDLIEAVGDLGSSEFVSISKNNEEVYTDGTTLVLKGGRDRND
jgi:hypothetical protein